MLTYLLLSMFIKVSEKNEAKNDCYVAETPCLNKFRFRARKVCLPVGPTHKSLINLKSVIG